MKEHWEVTTACKMCDTLGSISVFVSVRSMQMKIFFIRTLSIATPILLTLVLPYLVYTNTIGLLNSNRLAIILNIISGLLFAPSVLDSAWIRKIESSLESISSNVSLALTKPQEYIQSILHTENAIVARIFVIGFISLCLIEVYFILTIILDIMKREEFITVEELIIIQNSQSHFSLVMIISLTGMFFAIFYLPIIIKNLFSEEIFRLVFGNKVSLIIDIVYKIIEESRFFIFLFLFSRIVVLFSALISLIVIFLIYIPIFIIYIIVFVVRYLFLLITKTLRGEEKLKRILIRWGILIFISGNLIQLMATFSK